ncbi:hypothetical protein EMIHUDRAFT_453575 [Emiliania huxleyi CCMP1516]|uniref:HMG box domain-containing protein n=2 Tax=Emiliania huxleyi TaxID=2903 RepID=A0A0D3I3X6_EMIH1|nr:hypothetical protein EMIHUDRAFT_453575 [Emiliania huxleyi CCMP1516]EOD05961.1 hypothetical protein EMIHUDRAFT_453575 [Emiliania huxleyi CCMP1516]|eukprot:XP_005758390.1 hypothetical protein EMIHUDRAFT_453575 [Emiliania huxleyi CCMP1516]
MRKFFYLERGRKLHMLLSPASALAAAENAVCYFDDDHQYETASEHSGDDEPRLPFSARLAAATTAAIANDMNGGDRAAPCLVTDLGRIAGARWSEMDAEAKAPREAEAREHKEREECPRWEGRREGSRRDASDRQRMTRTAGRMPSSWRRPGLESSLGLGGGRVGSGGGPFCRWGQVRRGERGQGAVPGLQLPRQAEARRAAARGPRQPAVRGAARPQHGPRPRPDDRWDAGGAAGPPRGVACTALRAPLLDRLARGDRERGEVRGRVADASGPRPGGAEQGVRHADAAPRPGRVGASPDRAGLRRAESVPAAACLARRSLLRPEGDSRPRGARVRDGRLRTF